MCIHLAIIFRGTYPCNVHVHVLLPGARGARLCIQRGGGQIRLYTLPDMCARLRGSSFPDERFYRIGLPMHAARSTGRAERTVDSMAQRSPLSLPKAEGPSELSVVSDIG